MTKITDDSSRVKLREISGEDAYGSDYINASHLDVKSLLVNTYML